MFRSCIWCGCISTPSETLIETSPLDCRWVYVYYRPAKLRGGAYAKTGELIWNHDRKLPERLSTCCGFVNRGLSVVRRQAFSCTLDAHLVALDIETGAVIWDAEIGDYKEGYSITSAPLAFKNMVVTGVAGGEFGVRGFVSARDAGTGRRFGDSTPFQSPDNLDRKPGAIRMHSRPGEGRRGSPAHSIRTPTCSFGRSVTPARIMKGTRVTATIFIPTVLSL